MRLLLICVCLLSAGANRLHASLTLYSDRATWASAANPTGSEDFNSFTADTQFRTQSVAVNNMLISGSGSIYNYILAVPTQLIIDQQRIDSSPFILGHVRTDPNSNTISNIRFDFSTPVYAWGADFRGIGNSINNSRINVFGSNAELQGSIATSSADNSSLQFIGFTSSAPVESVLIVNTVNSADVFGMDNVQFSITAVPEPTSIAGFGMLTIGFAVLRLRKSRLAKVDRRSVGNKNECS